MSRIVLVVATLLCFTSTLWADVDYEADIKPIFLEKCAACHGVLQQEAGLRLDAGSLIRGDDEPNGILDLEHPAASLLIDRVTATDIDERMPPAEQGTPLTDQQVQQLLQWIEFGAPSPADEVIMDSPSQHWAYQSPVNADLPADVPASWATNPIDSLMFDQWRQTGLVAIESAEPATFLRRLYFDLTGLPPTREDQNSFVADPSDEVLRETVERLLDDPGYGENWARYWMDVWRYSDWDGYKDEVRGSQPHIWHWRDWIVESLNADKGYDTMTREMLAGDELAPEDLDVLRATGFLVRNFHKSNRDIWLDATVEHTAKAFLGMTIACARCHDHKYDPISQKEYYAFRAMFEPHQVRTERLPGQSDTGKQGLPRAYDADLNIATYLYVSGNEKSPDTDHPLTPAVPQIIQAPFSLHAVELPNLASHPFLRDYVEAEDLAEARQILSTARQQLASINAQDNVPQASAVAYQEVSVADVTLDALQRRWTASKARVSGNAAAADLAIAAAGAERQQHFQTALLELLKGRETVANATDSKESDEQKKQAALAAAKTKLAQAERKLIDTSVSLVATDGKFTPVGQSYPATSSGRRTALADWITHRDNPLTARVAINHIWLHYFGEPLVQSVDDFGLRAARPIQQKLLDWLAVDLMENNWSMKHIHRLILTSRVYALASSPTSSSDHAFAINTAIDPDNLHFWRANVRRLSSEQIRDSLLAIGGNLDRTMGGADIDFRDGETTLRRSLYFRHAYEKQMKMLIVFDAANPTDCYRRSESIIPQQALALANSTLGIDQARRTATLLSSSAIDDSEFINVAFSSVLGRPATASEIATCASFLGHQATLVSDPDELSTAAGTDKTTVPPASDPNGRARENLIHVLINHNDFVTLR